MPTSKKAIIVGVDGQDGTLIYHLLIKKNYRIIGIGRKNMRFYGINKLKPIDITKPDEVAALLKKWQPDEVYYFAAFHHSSQDQAIKPEVLIRKSYQINVFGLVNFLEGIRQYSPHTKIFYASSSLVFAGTKSRWQTEKTAYCPNSIYGITKLDGLLLCRLYRTEYHLFTAVGILYNHESIYRPEKFISKKIIQGALNIKNGQANSLVIGNLHSAADWGYAPDYIEAMYKIMQLKKSDEFIIASSRKHSVLDFVTVVFNHLGLDWKKYVRVNKKIVTRHNKTLIGDIAKLRKLTGWKPKTDFKKMIIEIVDHLPR